MSEGLTVLSSSHRPSLVSTSLKLPTRATVIWRKAISFVCIGPLILGRRGGCRGSAMAPFERAMAVSYRLSIVTIALFLTIRPKLALTDRIVHNTAVLFVSLLL